ERGPPRRLEPGPRQGGGAAPALGRPAPLLPGDARRARRLPLPDAGPEAYARPGDRRGGRHHPKSAPPPPPPPHGPRAPGSRPALKGRPRGGRGLLARLPGDPLGALPPGRAPRRPAAGLKRLPRSLRLSGGGRDRPRRPALV